MRCSLTQSDLKGTLPATVVNFVSSSQPLIIANLRRVMEEDFKQGSTKSILGGGRKKPTYDGEYTA